MSQNNSFTAIFLSAGGTMLWQDQAIGDNIRDAAQNALRNVDTDDINPSDGSAPASSVRLVSDTDPEGVEWDVDPNSVDSPFAPLP